MYTDCGGASAQLDADVGRGLRTRQLHRHKGRRLGNTARDGEQPAAAAAACDLFGAHDPAARQVRVDVAGHGHRSDRYAGLPTGRDDLRLELGAVSATAATAIADLVWG